MEPETKYRLKPKVVKAFFWNGETVQSIWPSWFLLAIAKPDHVNNSCWITNSGNGKILNIRNKSGVEKLKPGGGYIIIDDLGNICSMAVDEFESIFEEEKEAV